MSPTHLPPPHHFNIYLMQSGHPEDGGSTFLQNDEHLTTTQNRNKRKTIISAMHIFWPCISYWTCSPVSTNLITAHVTFVLHALTVYTTKPTVKPMQWCTHFGNLMNTLILILHPIQCVIEDTYVMTNFSSEWAWSTSDIEGCWFHFCLVIIVYWVPSWIIVYFTKSRVKYLMLCYVQSLCQEVSVLCSVWYTHTISGGKYRMLCYIHSHCMRR